MSWMYDTVWIVVCLSSQSLKDVMTHHVRNRCTIHLQYLVSHRFNGYYGTACISIYFLKNMNISWLVRLEHIMIMIRKYLPSSSKSNRKSAAHRPSRRLMKTDKSNGDHCSPDSTITRPFRFSSLYLPSMRTSPRTISHTGVRSAFSFWMQPGNWASWKRRTKRSLSCIAWWIKGMLFGTQRVVL